MNIENVRQLYAAGDLGACEVVFVQPKNRWLLQFFRKSTDKWISLDASKRGKPRLFPKDRLTTPIEIARVIGFIEVPVKIGYMPENSQINAYPRSPVYNLDTEKTEGQAMLI